MRQRMGAQCGTVESIAQFLDDRPGAAYLGGSIFKLIRLGFASPSRFLKKYVYVTQVVVDFGQELVTSVHRPIKWSDARPNDAEFKLAFAQTRISAQRIFDFVKKRHCAVRRLVLLNSEGYWSGEWRRANVDLQVTALLHVWLHTWRCFASHSAMQPLVSKPPRCSSFSVLNFTADEHDFVSLRHKHNFGASSFGVLLCLLRENLKGDHPRFLLPRPSLVWRRSATPRSALRRIPAWCLSTTIIYTHP